MIRENCLPGERCRDAQKDLMRRKSWVLRDWLGQYTEAMKTEVDWDSKETSEISMDLKVLGGGWIWVTRNLSEMRTAVPPQVSRP